MQESQLHGFGWSARKSAKRLRPLGHGLGRGRGLRFEPLEDRRMLSVVFVDDIAASGGNGAAWSTAFNDLQPALEAVAAFNSDAISENDVTQIWIAEGTYTPSAKLEPDDERSVSFSLVDGVTLYGGFDGTETALSERDLSEHETILSGDIGVVDDSTDNAYTVVYCGEGVAAAVDGLTISGGTSDRGNGGGILNEAGFLNITECVIRDCNAWNGGGVYNSGTLTVVDSEFTANSADDGGGLYSEGNATVSDSMFCENTARSKGGGISNYGDATVSDATLCENTARSRGGGISSEGNLQVLRSTLSDNTAESGAGIHGFGTVNVTESIVRDNMASGSGIACGSGIAVESGELNVINSTISGNSTSGFLAGGGIAAFQSDVHIEGSTVTANSASWKGGGISVFGTLSVNDSHITDNTAKDAGGGVYCSETLILSNSTLSGNTVGSEESYVIDGGGAVFGKGETTITNCIVSGNSVVSEWPNGYGGGVDAVGALSIIDSVFSSNRADINGGGIYAQNSITISRSEFYGNNSGHGGAVRCDDVATMANVFFGGNTSHGGGALDLATDAILSNCVFVGNSASYSGAGGAIEGLGEWTITNSTFTQNTDDYGHGAIGAYGTANVTNSIFWQNGGGDFGGDGDFVVAGNLVGIDPRFRENPSDGGDGWGDDPETPDVDESANDNYGDLRLAPGSPGIDKGDRTLLPADTFDFDADGDVGEPLPVDLAGEVRVQSVRVDIGAYEYVVHPDMGDGVVGSADLDIVRANWGRHVTPGDLTQGDVSGNGVVDSIDLDIVRMHYGEVLSAAARAPVPAATDAVFAAEPDVGSSAAKPTLIGPVATPRKPHVALAALTDAAWQREMFGKADSSDTAKRATRTAALLAFLEP